MSQKFVKGYTNNHLTWVMVDATDFATPESALSAATAIKIYGKVKGATGVHFVSSGAGSLTNDIQHVGASALGIYTIALVKADLSDASQAWYDQYIIALSATGAARQVLVVDGGIIESYLSATLSDVQSAADSQAVLRTSTFSDIFSYFAALSDALSNVHSEVTSQFVVTSNYLSYISATVSALGAGASPSAVAAAVWSDFESKAGASPSQLYSVVLIGTSAASNAASAATVLLSRVPSIVATSGMLSDTQSYLVAMSGMLSDTHSAATAAAAGASPSAVAAAVWSDYESKVGHSASQVYSVALVGASRISDIQSYLVALSDMVSNAYSAAVQGSARALIVISQASDIQSALSDFHSDFQSRIPAPPATASAVADVIWSDFESKMGVSPSQLYSVLLLAGSRVSDVYSAITTARAEPGTSDVSATNTPFRKLDYLFKAWRNTQQQDATSYVLYNDDGTTAGQKATVADDAASFTRGEMGSG